MDTSLVRSPARPFGSTGHVLLLVGLFWLFTYALLSWRIQILAGDAFQVISARRLLGTTVGALVYWMLLEWLQVARRRNPFAILAAILPGTLVVLIARLAFERVYYPEPISMSLQLGWVMAWAGYFGLWVSASLAVTMHRQMAAACARAADAAAVHAIPPVTADSPWGAVVNRGQDVPAETWDWLIDSIAAELAEAPDAARADLARRLVERAGYQAADGTTVEADHNLRVELAYRLAARLAERT